MKNFTPRQKAAIALAALKGEKISKLASIHQSHPNQIGKWKKLLETEIANLAFFCLRK